MLGADRTRGRTNGSAAGTSCCLEVLGIPKPDETAWVPRCVCVCFTAVPPSHPHLLLVEETLSLLHELVTFLPRCLISQSRHDTLPDQVATCWVSGWCSKWAGIVIMATPVDDGRPRGSGQHHI